eukprot:1176082-Prorocentrum_minimum.AAC.3
MLPTFGAGGPRTQRGDVVGRLRQHDGEGGGHVRRAGDFELRVVEPGAPPPAPPPLPAVEGPRHAGAVHPANHLPRLLHQLALQPQGQRVVQRRLDARNQLAVHRLKEGGRGGSGGGVEGVRNQPAGVVGGQGGIYRSSLDACKPQNPTRARGGQEGVRNQPAGGPEGVRRGAESAYRLEQLVRLEPLQQLDVLGDVLRVDDRGGGGYEWTIEGDACIYLPDGGLRACLLGAVLRFLRLHDGAPQLVCVVLRLLASVTKR